MRGSVSWQIEEIFKKSEIFKPGESKHDDKERARDILGKTPATSQRISSLTDLHSYGAAYDYKDTWHKIGQHARGQGLKDMTQMTPEHVTSYLNERMEEEIALSTWRKEASHAGKLGRAISKVRGEAVDFREAINKMRPEAKDALENPDRDRGYVEPQNVIQEIKDPISRVLAKVQLEGGARCHEVGKIRADQLSEGNTIHLTNTKGGYPRDITVQPDTYMQLQEMLRERGGIIQVKSSTYRNQIARAAKLAGEINTGTHDLRYNFARERYWDLTREGYLPEQAHYLISEEMGHHRPDITLHYLK